MIFADLSELALTRLDRCFDARADPEREWAMAGEALYWADQ